MRKMIIKRFFVLISLMILLLLPVTFTSCKRGIEPWGLNNVVWYSEDPVIEFTKSEELEWEGTVLVDGEYIQIKMLWGYTYSFEIIDAEKDDGKTSVEKLRLMNGKFDCGKETVMLTVKNDKLFNNKYKKIVLKYRKLSESYI